MDPSFKILAELGIIGALFIMWWFERKDRLAAEKKKAECDATLKESVASMQVMMNIVESNTEAMVSLREMISSTNGKIKKEHL